MPRKPRSHQPGRRFHVTSRGNGGKDIFLDEEDYRRFAAEIVGLRPLGLKTYADCLMPNHFHLLVEVGTTPLATLMQQALSRYAQYFNYRRGTFGHVFQGRYFDSPCDTEAYFLESIRYIHRNPVRAGLVSDPIDWIWSSHRAFLGVGEDPLPETEFPLSLFSNDLQTARRLYSDFMARAREAQAFSASRRTPRAPLEAIALDCASEMNVNLADVLAGSQRRPAARTRRLIVRKALDVGYSAKELAKFLGCVPSAISKMLMTRPFTDSFTSGSDPSFTS